ncbi:MAG: LamG domain-containing protein [Crocinitomicaceae bacterium]
MGGDLTVSAWMNSSSVSGHIINRGGGWNDPGYSLFLLSNTIRIELQRTGEKDIVDNGVSINAWLYVALTYNGTTNVIRCYIDGVQQGNTGNHTGPIGTPVENLNIGRKEQNAFYFDGIIDEGRVISAERNAEWMLTEYRNQNTPNSFYTKSVEYGAASLCWTLPVEFLDFAVKPVNNSDALVK